MKILEWMKDHPWEAGGIIFIGGLFILYILGFFGGSSSSAGSGTDATVSDFLAAQTAQVEYGDALQATQVQANAATAQSLINANANVDINNTWGAVNVADTQEQTKQGLVSTIGQLANDLGTVLTNSKSSVGTWFSGSSSSGIFGLGGGSSSAGGGVTGTQSSQTLAANEEQQAAVGLLSQITNTEFAPMH